MVTVPFNGLSKYRILLEPGEIGTWEESGVRDPAVLMDKEGNPYKIDNKMFMYYTGSRKNSTIQSVGCATSDDDGKTWIKYENNPVIFPRPNGIEDSITSTPWAIVNDDKVYLYYRTSSGNNDSISLAMSEDGFNFSRYPENPILTSDDFSDLDEGTMLGVVNCAVLPNKKYILTFEANSKKYISGQIYGAISDDGINFNPLNDGKPFFCHMDVVDWPVLRVCNPRITVINEKIILGFNAHYENGYWAIGFAETYDLKSWKSYDNNPVLLPSEQPIDNPHSGRLEGPVLLFEDINKSSFKEMIIMAIPKKGPSHVGSVISAFELSDVNLPSWLQVTVDSGLEIKTEDQKTIINVSDNYKNNKIFINLQKLDNDIILKMEEQNYDIWIGCEYNSEFSNFGSRYEIRNNNLIFKQVHLFEGTNLLKKIVNKISRHIPYFKNYLNISYKVSNLNLKSVRYYSEEKQLYIKKSYNGILTIQLNDFNGLVIRVNK